MNRRQLDDLQTYATFIVTNHDAYQRAINDYVRGGLPTTSLPTGHHSNEPALPAFDPADQAILGRQATIDKALTEARRLLEIAERGIRWMITPTKRPDDPEPRSCTNLTCPDNRIFSMIGRDRPQDAAGRCDACRKFHERNGRERTRKYTDILTADAEALAETVRK